MSVKVLLADDADVVRVAIRRLLREQPEIEIVGDTADFAQAVRMMEDLKPQVVVMDLHLAVKTNAPLTDVKACLNHGSRLLAISMSNDEDCKDLAKNLGAVKILDKMKLGTELIPTILTLGLPENTHHPRRKN